MEGKQFFTISLTEVNYSRILLAWCQSDVFAVRLTPIVQRKARLDPISLLPVIENSTEFTIYFIFQYLDRRIYSFSTFFPIGCAPRPIIIKIIKSPVPRSTLEV